MPAYEEFTTTSPEFKQLVPEFEGSMDSMVRDYDRIVDAVNREFDELNSMKDDSDSKSASPTQLARKELIDFHQNDAENVIYESIDAIADAVTQEPEAGLAYAEVLREWADHFQFIGDLHAQHLRNQKYAGNSETDGDAVAKRENVGRLLQNIKKYQGVAPMLSIELPDRDVPNLQGNKVGISSSGVRKSSAYPVLELNMKFTIDGEEVASKSGISDAVINHLFPRLGKYSYGLDIEHSVVGALKKENPNWTGAGETTSLFFQSGDDDSIVEFTVHIVRKNEVAE